MLITYATNDFPAKYAPTVSGNTMMNERERDLCRYSIIMLLR